MGQSNTKSTPNTASLLVSNAVPDADSDSHNTVYMCKLSSSKQEAPDIEFTTGTTQTAHGTCFVYFQTTSPVVLADYNHIICRIQDSTVPSTIFITSMLHHDTKIVHKGASYHQFVTPMATDRVPHSRFIARTKSQCTKNQSHTFFSGLYMNTDGDDGACGWKGRVDDRLDWEFVWEVGVAR